MNLSHTFYALYVIADANALCSLLYSAGDIFRGLRDYPKLIRNLKGYASK